MGCSARMISLFEIMRYDLVAEAADAITRGNSPEVAVLGRP
jgi:hypothetical protein